jgi:D-amino-acid dehydrogenase
MRVLIVGAGIVGASTALELARRGAGVTVVDRGGVGGGCSHGNAGWLTPCFAFPLAAPGVLSTGLRWLLDPDSPLYITPSLGIEGLRWVGRFAMASTAARFERGMRALVALSKHSLEAYAALDREYPGAFGFSRTGLLMVAQTQDGLAHAKESARLVERHGIAARVLDAAGVRELEPAVSGPVAGGVFFPGEAHCEPRAAVETTARAAEAAGARFLTDTEVVDFERSGSRIAGVLTTRGRLEADRYVLATGSWSKALARRLDLRLPVLGGKGYAVVVPTFPGAPRLPIKVLERRIAITPRDGSVRLAGTLELVDGDESITTRRVEAIVRGSRTVLNLPDPVEFVDLWRGLRPCAPDGMPVIGFAPGVDNLLLATGHQMCGLHAAPGTGRLAADLLTGSPPTFDPAPFRADRF